MLEEKYPSESWVIVYTDGSATNTTTKGGTGIYIQYPHGEQQSEAIPTGLHGGIFVISSILCIGVDFIAPVMIRSARF
jgi:hypothetical protein